MGGFRQRQENVEKVGSRFFPEWKHSIQEEA